MMQADRKSRLHTDESALYEMIGKKFAHCGERRLQRYLSEFATRIA